MFQNRQKLLILFLTIITVLGVSYLLESFVIFPGIGEWSTNQAQLQTEKQKEAAIKESVVNLKSLDKSKIEALKAFTDILIPDQFDSFHFASLNEIVSAASGVNITSVTITRGAGGTTTSVGKGQTNQTAPSLTNVTYTSGFDALLSLIKNWVVADRLVGPTTITIAGQVGTPILTYTIGYQLPIAPATPPATADDKISISSSQIDQLGKLRSSIIYTATPSARPVGSKDNPFQ